MLISRGYDDDDKSVHSVSPKTHWARFIELEPYDRPSSLADLCPMTQIKEMWTEMAKIETRTSELRMSSIMPSKMLSYLLPARNSLYCSCGMALIQSNSMQISFVSSKIGTHETY